jgi:hypothetical protein
MGNVIAVANSTFLRHISTKYTDNMYARLFHQKPMTA